jgi:hypothetical protein
VRFAVEVAEDLELISCNCSICAMSGFVHLIVPKQAFRLLKGEEALAEYRFNTGTARHLFCRHCGIKSFYYPRSHPDGVSVNARCLDDDVLEARRIRSFDGRHWEQNIEAL